MIKDFIKDSDYIRLLYSFDQMMRSENFYEDSIGSMCFLNPV